MAESTTPAVLVEPGPALPTHPDQLTRLAGAFVAGHRSKNTQRAYREDLRMWFRWCHANDVDPLVGIQRVHGELYARHMEDKGLAPATRFRRIGTVRGWYEWLIDEELWDGRNPMRKVKQPTVTVVRDLPHWTRAQANIALRASLEHSPRLGAIVHLGLINGLRIGEICGADVGDLGTQGYYRTLLVRGKGEKYTHEKLEPPVAAAVDAAVGDRTSGPLILTRAGTRMNRRAAGHMLDTLARTHGLPRITPHALRRTAIILLVQSRKPIREIQLYARHASSVTTERYDTRVRTMEEHLSGEVLRAVA